MQIVASTGDSTAPLNPKCQCGCGYATRTSTAFYLPGHDARHAGQVGRYMAPEPYEMWAGFCAAAKLSEALTAKAYGVAEKATDKARAKEERENARALKKDAKAAAKAKKAAAKADQVVEVEKPDYVPNVEGTPFTQAMVDAGAESGAAWFTEGTVKVGRWGYPARKWTGGVVERNEKRDGSGAWIETCADFYAN